MNGPNQLAICPSQYFVYRAEGFLDQTSAGVTGSKGSNVLMHIGPCTTHLSPAAARELAAHLVAAADVIDSQQGGEA